MPIMAKTRARKSEPESPVHHSKRPKSSHVKEEDGGVEVDKGMEVDEEDTPVRNEAPPKAKQVVPSTKNKNATLDSERGQELLQKALDYDDNRRVSNG